jgi:hypothetical protein
MAGPDDELDAAAEIVLSPGGGGGGDKDWHQNCGVWPLPPEGPVTFVCEWLDAGISESRIEVEGEILIGAAARARQVWPAEPGIG